MTSLAPASRRKALLFGTCASALAALIAVACSSRSVTLALDVPGAVVDGARWYEVGAVEGSTCPPPEQFLGGIPAGFRIRKSFSRENAPNFGNLVAGTYAFAAVAKSDDCTVLAAGCTIADVTSDDAVSVRLTETAGGTGCSPGTICQVAQCVPPNDNNDPSIGAGCTLDLLGSGPLTDPLRAPSASGQVVSQPAIVATPKGFLIAYRETEGPSNTQLTVLPIDTSGGALAPQRTVIESCGPLRDGVGMAFHGEEGLLVAAKPCKPEGGTAPGLLVFSIDADGKTRQGGFSLLPCSDCGATTSLSLGLGHSVAWSDAVTPGGAFLVSFIQAGQSQVLVRAATPSVTKFGTGKDLDAQLVAQGNFLGLLSTAAATPVGDGGVAPDAGVPNRLGVGFVTANKLASLGAPSTTPATWGSIAVLGTRVFVVTDGTAKQLTLRGYQPRATSPDQLDLLVNDPNISESSVGDPVFADIAGTGDRLFIVAQRAKGTTLLALDHAATTPVRIREVNVPGTGVASGGRIAVAATDTRVAVAWITRPELTSNDRVGGYAVYACR